MKTIIEKLKKIKIAIISTLIVITNKTICFAGNMSNFKFFSGTQNLLNDLTAWGLLIIPILCVVLIIYFNGRKAAAEQNEQPMWTKRRNIAIACCIGAEVADGLITWLLSYYT